MAQKKEKEPNRFGDNYEKPDRDTLIMHPEPPPPPLPLSAGMFPTHAKTIAKSEDSPEVVAAFGEPKDNMKMARGYADGGMVQPQDQAINDYFSNQKKSVDQFGPDYQKMVADHLTEQQNGLGHNVAKAGAGFADALMQGVSRAGNPGFLQSIEGQDQRNFENQTNLGRSLNEQNQAGIKEKMGMDQMNPASVLGAAKVHGAFTAMKSAFPQMADNDIQTFVSSPAFSELFPQLAGLRGKEIENQWKGQELDLGNRRLQSEDADRKLARELEASRIASEAKNQERQREQEQERTRLGAQEKLAGEGIFGRLSNPAFLNPAKRALEETAGLAQPEERKTKDGRIALFDPKTKQFKGYK